MRASSVLVLWLACAACAVLERPLVAPAGSGPVILVLSNRMPGPIRKLARHAYLAVRTPDRLHWRIWECCGARDHDSRDPFTPSFGDDVRLHGVITGPRAQAAATCIERETARYGDPSYWPWPGPNSNTYVDAMLRRCDLHVDLPPTAIGKDHRGALGVSWTSGGTGFQIESPILGLRLGLTEGVEIHVLGLAFGIDLWPPAIIVPFGGGRIGFADR
jgi:hypothetical protein